MSPGLTPTADSRGSNIRLAILLLMFAAATSDLAVNCRGLATAFQAIEWGAAPMWLGLIAAAGSVAYTLLTLLAGRLSDRVGRKVTAIGATLLAALSMWGLYQSERIWHLALYSGAYGASVAFFWPTLSAWFSDMAASTGRHLNRMLGNFNLAWSSGMVLGALLGGVWWRAWGAGSFLVLIIVLVSTAVGLFFVPEFGGKATTRPPEPKAEAGISPETNRRFLLSARLLVFLSWFMSGVILTILPKLANLRNMPEYHTGLAIAAFYVSLVLLIWLGRTSSRWQYRRWPLILPVPLAIVGMGLVATAESLPAFVLACFIAGTCAALAAVCALYYALHGRQSGRAASTAVHEAVVGLGAVAGALVSGFLAEHLVKQYAPELALRGTFLIVLLVAALVGIAQLIAWHVMRQRQPA